VWCWQPCTKIWKLWTWNKAYQTTSKGQQCFVYAILFKNCQIFHNNCWQNLYKFTVIKKNVLTYRLSSVTFEEEMMIIMITMMIRVMTTMMITINLLFFFSTMMEWSETCFKYENLNLYYHFSLWLYSEHSTILMVTQRQ